MPKFILFTHQKGGVGKSTLANNISKQVKELAKVAIIDIDPQGSINKTKDFIDTDVFLYPDLERLKTSDYDFIFIDTPPYLTDKLPKLIDLADVIIVPTKVGYYDILAIEDTIEIIKRHNKENNSLIVFNMVKPNTTLTNAVQEQIDEYNITVSRNYISDLIALTRSAIKSDLESKKANRQINLLTKEIFEMI